MNDFTEYSIQIDARIDGFFDIYVNHIFNTTCNRENFETTITDIQKSFQQPADEKKNCDTCSHSRLWETSHEWLDLVCTVQKSKPCWQIDAKYCPYYKYDATEK